MPGAIAAGLLLAHALIHASYLTPQPAARPGAPAWPFDLARSRLLAALGLRGELPRPLGMALVALTIAGFGLACLAAIGVVPGSLWAAGIAVGALASLALLGVFFHPWLVLGVVIDLVLLYAVLVTGWAPAGLAA